MVKENLNSRQRFVKWEQEGHERKIENQIATTLHPASAAITDQWVCVALLYLIYRRCDNFDEHYLVVDKNYCYNKDLCWKDV